MRSDPSISRHPSASQEIRRNPHLEMSPARLKTGWCITSLVGTMKHVSTPSQKVVKRHTMSRPCRTRVASVS
eukprot:7352820-Prymnesium_polylepis.1